MNDRNQFAIVIPAYNETLTITQVITEALKQSKIVIVVNDASQDDTAELVKKTDAILVDLPVNGGKAKALQAGFEKALSFGVEAVITLDGDAQHNPADIPKLLAYFAKNPNDLCVASRLKDRQNAPRSRRIANSIADFWVSWAAGKPIADSQSGFRLYPSSLLKLLKRPYENKSGFVFESEVLIDSAHLGYGFAFIPIDTIYAENRRASHFRAGFDITQITLMVAKKLLKKGMNLPGLVRSLTQSPNIIQD
ncbi:glycosyl transferase [Thiomicrorhabdus immobilis]|uniref:Glycosyl transferase n=1 Tax=Thiomicrorhabdus immobilis TaxID=2791037 RepID=A0ABN6CVT5_9GAMM|nr:glycosyltransferase family 2 protein [Thiomicrorhabdus immobilis]BCN93095.1 glycosyl transferase [Thiomicrorhabdus immobilis]